MGQRRNLNENEDILELTNSTIIIYKHLCIQFGENWVQVHGLSLFYLYDFLWIYNYFNIKSSRVALTHILLVSTCSRWDTFVGCKFAFLTWMWGTSSSWLDRCRRNNHRESSGKEGLSCEKRFITISQTTKVRWMQLRKLHWDSESSAVTEITWHNSFGCCQM